MGGSEISYDYLTAGVTVEKLLNYLPRRKKKMSLEFQKSEVHHRKILIET